VEGSRSLDDPNNARKKILIVDDEPDVTFTIKVILTSNGYQVDAFEDAEEALAQFRKEAYFLAFLDIKMPKMNGFDLYKKLLEIDKDIKVCFLTALGEFDG
jgi:DNA-binding response OmpR family regulator